MATVTPTLLLDTLRSLLDGAALREAEALAEGSEDSAHIVAELVRRQRLTQYQADELLHGRGPQLVLGAYILLEPIGKGGMGQVFRARQNVLQRDCAVKLIRKDRLQTQESVERFLREARVAAKLKHTNIVGIYDAGAVEGVHFLAMELLHGVTLGEHVKKHGPLSVGHACRYLCQAALGLQHAHEQGLVHRDIKPQNLFLEASSDQVKILDLGLARVRETLPDGETATGDLTREGEVMGTPDYMAPEQAADSRSADQRADIYSLGCTLYFLISGRPPFPGGSLTEKLLAHQQKEPPSLESLGAPEQLVQVLRKAMAKQPDDRFASPRELADALATLENCEHVIAASSLPMPGARTITRDQVETATMPPSASRPRTSVSWFLVLLLVGLVGCVPLAAIGAALLGVAMLILVPAGDKQKDIVNAPGPHQGDDPKDGIKEPKEPVKPDMVMWELKAFDGRDFVLSRDGTRMIHDISDASFTFEVREFDTGKKVFSLPKGHEGLGFAWGSPERVVSAKDRSVIHLNDGDTGNELSKFPNPFGAYSEYVTGADQKSALVAIGKFLIVWNLEAGNEKHRVTLPDFPKHIAMSADGTLGFAVCKDRLQAWTLAADFVEREFEGFPGGITAATMSLDSNWVVAGDAQGKVYLWRRELPRDPRRLEHLHSTRVSCAAFSPDSKRFVTGDAFGNIIYWDAATGSKIQTALVGAPVTRVAIHADGRRVVTASSDKKIRVWRLPK